MKEKFCLFKLCNIKMERNMYKLEDEYKGNNALFLLPI